MSARGDARKRQAEKMTWSGLFGIDPTYVSDSTDAYDEHADILAELAETQAALHAATNDVVRLAAELHTAHGQVDRARMLADEWEADRGILSPDSRYTRDVLVRELRRALDGGAS